MTAQATHTRESIDALDTDCMNCGRRDDHWFCWRWLEWLRTHTGGWKA